MSCQPYTCICGASSAWVGDWVCCGVRWVGWVWLVLGWLVCQAVRWLVVVWALLLVYVHAFLKVFHSPWAISLWQPTTMDMLAY